MPFPHRLKELRNHLNLSQKELAEQLNVSPGAVAHWELGNRQPGYDMLKLLSDFFNVSIDFLLGTATKNIVYERLISSINITYAIEDSYLRNQFREDDFSELMYAEFKDRHEPDELLTMQISPSTIMLKVSNWINGNDIPNNEEEAILARVIDSRYLDVSNDKIEIEVTKTSISFDAVVDHIATKLKTLDSSEFKKIHIKYLQYSKNIDFSLPRDEKEKYNQWFEFKREMFHYGIYLKREVAKEIAIAQFKESRSENDIGLLKSTFNYLVKNLLPEIDDEYYQDINNLFIRIGKQAKDVTTSKQRVILPYEIDLVYKATAYLSADQIDQMMNILQAAFPAAFEKAEKDLSNSEK